VAVFIENYFDGDYNSEVTQGVFRTLSGTYLSQKQNKVQGYNLLQKRFYNVNVLTKVSVKNL
jgi:hypothetical protein